MARIGLVNCAGMDESRDLDTTPLAGALPIEEEARARDGTRLMLRRWSPGGAGPGAARGTVVLVHGLGEHIGRYEHVAAWLRHRGFAVLGFDQRGHGCSQGPRGGLRSSDDLLEDLTLVVDLARQGQAGPLVLLGHSMGGQVAASFVAGRIRPVEALVLSSPALDPGLSAFNRGLLALMWRLAPDFALPSRLDAHLVSHDPQVERDYRSDPLVHDLVTARLVRAIVDGGTQVRRQASQWSVPTLLMWAGADKLVAPSGSAEFAAKAPGTVVESHCFEHDFHEVFNEPDKEQVFARLRDWLDRHVPAPAKA